jgi:hypothetical protein
MRPPFGLLAKRELEWMILPEGGGGRKGDEKHCENGHWGKGSEKGKCHGL